jgi:MFS family permease
MTDAAPERTRARSRFSALAYPHFRNFWISSMVSAIGNGLIPVTLAFAVLRTGGGALELSYVLASGAIAQVALLPVGGVWSDWLPRKTVIIGANVASALLYTGMGLLLFSGNAREWQFIVLSVLSAAAKALLRPATSGLVAQTVPAVDLQLANALMSLSNSIPMVGGPAVAGALATLAGPGWAFVIDGVSFVAATALMAPIPTVSIRRSAEANRFWHDLVVGGREVTETPWLWRNLVAHGLWNLGFVMLFVIGPVMMIKHSHVAGWAAVSTAIAFGSVAGALVALRVRAKRPLVAGNLAVLTGVLPFAALFAGAPGWIVAVCAALAAVGIDVLNAQWNATIQRLVPPERLARVTSYDWMISLSSTPLSYLAAGAIIRSVGTSATLVVAMALTAVPTSLVVLAPSVRSVFGPEAKQADAPVPAADTI